MYLSKSSRAVIVVGLIGCFMTSVAGVTAVLTFNGWAAQGGWTEWVKRIAIAYSAASMVVVVVFPWLVPKLMKWLMNSTSPE
jgi:hypothetical protein